MPDDLPLHPVRDGKVLDLQIHLLDRALLDRRGVPVLAVEDVEVDWPEEGPVTVTALVLGSGLTRRFFKAHQPRRPGLSVPWSDVSRLGSAIHLAVDRDGLDATWFERWLREHVVARIPGSRHASE